MTLNKALKYIPGLQAFTGRGAAAPLTETLGCMKQFSKAFPLSI